MADWPASLPGLRLPVDHQIQSGLIRTKMDAGPDKVRRRSSATPENFSFPMRLKGSEYDTLQTFYNSTLGGGALSFNFDNPRTDTEETFRFLSPPNATVRKGASDPDDRIWDVQISLEKL